MRLLSCFLTSALLFAGEPGDWPVYGHDAGGSRFSPLTQINRTNVGQLRLTWTFRTGDMYDPKAQHTFRGRATVLETTPLMVDNTLYLTTPLGRVIALDPATGQKRWDFQAHVDPTAGYGDFTNRGVATWKDPRGARYLYLATIDARLIAINAATGQAVPGFGQEGQIDLRAGLRLPPESQSEYEETSPPTVLRDLVIVGSAVADNGRTNAASGEVRAFDTRTGALRWTFHTIPQDDTKPAARTWQNGSNHRTGAANAWSIMAADPERNLVFVPVGSASVDYYGGERLGHNLYANCLVALRGDTGEVAWHFQTVHHDLWDYDVASPPVLVTVRQNGRAVPAVAVGSKTGHLFLLHRETGIPLFPVEERPVPASDVPGEVAATTQPSPTRPPALVPQRLTAAEAWGINDEERQWCRETISRLRADGVFTPPSTKGSLIFPGNIGGMAWGGASYDAAQGLLLVPTNRLPAVIQLVPRDQWRKEADAHPEWEGASMKGTSYGLLRHMLLNPHGRPCNAPPWGALSAVDVHTGAIRWEVPLGNMAAPGAPASPADTGAPNLGGPLSTAGGVTLIGATLDPHFRAFDTATGKKLWEIEMPTSARSTPMTYQAANGRQYVVIAAGGHDTPYAPQGDYLLAYALP